MKTLHLVKVRFDRRTERATQEWLDRRYRFFAENTLPSLLGQTVRGWTLWVNFQEGMEDQLERFTKAVVGDDPYPVSTVVTFGDGPVTGLTLLPGLYRVAVTRIDSDDLFAPDALHCVDAVFTDPNAVEVGVFPRGYLYQIPGRTCPHCNTPDHEPIAGFRCLLCGGTGKLLNDRVGVYCNSSSPFHTVYLPPAVFADPRRYEEVWHKIGDHSGVASSGFKCHRLPDWKFAVLIHGDNFLSDFDYCREADAPVERGWSVPRFLSQPVVFDVDDFNDHWGGETLAALSTLKGRYPDFRCTLFTIPEGTSLGLLQEVERLNSKDRSTPWVAPWIELAVHGISHDPNEELRSIRPSGLGDWLDAFAESPKARHFVKGFRPPGWYATGGHARELGRRGYWLACALKDRVIGRECSAGHYLCDSDRAPYWHGHTHDVCGNWLTAALPDLLGRWPESQAFSFVSDAVLVPQR